MGWITWPSSCSRNAHDRNVLVRRAQLRIDQAIPESEMKDEITRAVGGPNQVTLKEENVDDERKEKAGEALEYYTTVLDFQVGWTWAGPLARGFGSRRYRTSGDLYRYDCAGIGRSPKSVVPMRTRVAPSSMAISKSPLIPMLRWAKGAPRRSSQTDFNSRSCRKKGRDRSGVGE